MDGGGYYPVEELRSELERLRNKLREVEDERDVLSCDLQDAQELLEDEDRLRRHRISQRFRWHECCPACGGALVVDTAEDQRMLRDCLEEWSFLINEDDPITCLNCGYATHVVLDGDGYGRAAKGPGGEA